MQLRVSVVVGLNKSALHFQLKLHTCKLLQCDFAHIFLIAKAVIDAVWYGGFQVSYKLLLLIVMNESLYYSIYCQWLSVNVESNE